MAPIQHLPGGMREDVPTFMRMKTTRVMKTLERGCRQASRMPMYSNSSLGSCLAHVRLSNNVTSVSF